MYQIVIVEDAPEEAQRLRAHIARFADERDLALTTTVLASALEFAERRPPADLIFMDIQMPGMTGMEAAELLRGYGDETPLVFVTNLAQYAVAGYAVQALDFLIKPVAYEAFVPCMERALRAMRHAAAHTVALPAPGGTRIVGVDRIVYVDMLRHDLHYHLEGEGEPVRMRGSMRQAETELGPHDFLRVSSGCMVNMAHVTMVRRESVVLSDGTELYFSRSRRKACLEALAGYVGSMP